MAKVPVMERQNEFWPPEPLWTGARVFLLAGGPSLTGFDASRLVGAGRILAINSSVKLAADIAGPDDVLFFMDNGWFDKHRTEIDAWPGHVICTSRRAKGALPDRIKRVDHAEMPDMTSGTKIKTGRSSGHVAISLSIALGARRIVLLGYDMKLVNGRSHHHNDHRHTDGTFYANEFIPGFKGWNDAAKRAGVEVVNATSGSELQEFPGVSLERELQA